MMIRARHSVWTNVTLALLALGILIRAALYFPLAKFQIDSDAMLSGLCGLQVSHGQHPLFFPGGTRLSAASCYVAAGYFHLFGPNRIAVGMTGLTWGVLYLVFSLLFLRAILGPKAGCVAFIFAVIPSEQFMTVSYAPWGYGEIMASCTATLWLAALWRNEGTFWQRLFFGFSVGLGIWFSLETLMIALPAIVWIAVKRRRATIEESIAAAFGALAGAVPFLAGNVGLGFPSLTNNWASRPASGLPQIWDNFVWLMSYMLPKLLFRSSGWWSETALLIAAYAIVAIAFVLAVSRNRRIDNQPSDVRDGALLVLLVLIACVSIFSLSEAGSSRGWTVRYIAPFYVVVPIVLGIGIQTLWAWSRVLFVVTVAAMLVPNLLLYGLPGSSLRSELTSQLEEQSKVDQLLARQNVGMIYGDYFWVYGMNFDSLEHVAGIPTVPGVDYLNYGDRLGTSPVRWALLGGLDEVRHWARDVHASGSLSRDGQLWLFIASAPARNAAQLTASLRIAH